jgi:DNA repair exonuclease SbcCD ATPase subunit
MPTDPLDDMPKIRLEKDDLESFHRTRAQSTNKSSKKGSIPDEPPTAKNSPSWFAFLLLLIIIVGAAVYWSFYQHAVLQQAQSNNTQLESRITELESRLSATGEDMDQSAAALQVKVSELSTKTEHLWSEMDKLWASAWRRNQSEIGDLDKTVKALKVANEKSAKSLSSDTADNNTSIGLVKEQLENQAKVLNQLNKQFNQVSSKDADFEQQLASLREKLISTALANNGLTDQIDELRRRVTATEKKANQVEKMLTGPTS